MEDRIKEMAEQASVRYANGQKNAFMAGVEWMEKHSNKLLPKEDKQVNMSDAPEMVDLGLPSGLKWAKWNVGATNESEYGKLFAFGDIIGSYTTKESCNGKYTEKWYDRRGFFNIKSDLTLKQDAANVAYGENYRMPTKEEIDELEANTTYSVEKINGVRGGKFTAPNGNYIFFPFAGYSDNGSLYDNSNNAIVWSSSFGDEYNAWYLYCDGEKCKFYEGSRCDGCSVRAVCE